MFGNGARTGMIEAIIVAVRQAILQDRHLALTACSVAVAGPALRRAVVCPIVTTSIQAS